MRCEKCWSIPALNMYNVTNFFLLCIAVPDMWRQCKYVSFVAVEHTHTHTMLFFSLLASVFPSSLLLNQSIKIYPISTVILVAADSDHLYANWMDSTVWSIHWTLFTPFLWAAYRQTCVWMKQQFPIEILCTTDSMFVDRNASNRINSTWITWPNIYFAECNFSFLSCKNLGWIFLRASEMYRIEFEWTGNKYRIFGWFST